MAKVSKMKENCRLLEFPPMGPVEIPGQHFGDNVLIGLQITNRNFNQLEAAFRHPPKTVPRGLQIPSQLASCFEYPFLSILGASWVDFW